MRPFIWIATAMIFTIATSCEQRNSLHSELKKLDEVVANKGLYEKEFERKVDSVMQRLDSASSDKQKFELLKKVMDHTLFYNTDMASETANRLISLEHKGNLDKEDAIFAKISYIKVLIDKDPELAGREFRKLDTTGISPEMLSHYYSCQGRIYIGSGAKAKDPEIIKAYADSLVIIRKLRERRAGCDRVTRARLLASDLREEGKMQEAFNLLKAEFDSSDEPMVKGLLAYGMSHSFKGQNRNKLEYWLAVSAFYDLQAPVKDYLSLYDLALLRMEDNDLKRAQEYMHCTTEDMVRSRFNSRIYDAARSQTLIDKTVIFNIHNRNRLLAIMAVITVMFLIILTFQLVKLNSQNKKLSDINKDIAIFNEQLKNVNSRLNDVNKIKDNYVSKYMELATKYIWSTETYRHLLKQAAKNEGTDAVMAKLREPSPVDKEFKEFFKIFDDLFTSLFPDFFEKISELTATRADFSLSGKKCLTTEMRIIAVIRLGITDSGKMARMLNCAPATIYTYRTKIKDALAEQNEDYVKVIQNICL